MLERDFQNEVIKFLKSQDIYYIKVWGGGYQKAGIPDLIICLNGLFIAVELKKEDGRPSALQLYNIEQIKKSKGQAIILKPSQFQEFKKNILEVKDNVQLFKSINLL